MTPVFSHPGVPLTDHLREVANGCVKILSERAISCPVPQSCLTDLGYIMGITHDITKATVNFQNYLFKRPYKKPKHHALMSAFVAKEVADHYLKTNWSGKIEQALFDVLPFMVFTAVKRHHGNLLDFWDELNELRRKDDDLQKQIKNFYQPEAEKILKELLEVKSLQFDWVQFENYIITKQYLDDYADFAGDFKSDFKNLGSDRTVQYFYIHQLLFSALLHSDKADVILERRHDTLPTIDFDTVNRYRTENKHDQPTTELNQLKNKAFVESLDYLEHHFDVNQHLHSVTLPTGLGKTITSLALAMKMRERLNNPAARIVIAIPFTSIIDQNFKVFQDIFKNPNSETLLKHHHLAEPEYKTNEEDEVLEDQESKFLIETWQSGVVITTFVQLLEGIFTNNKSKLLKFPNFTNAVIVLDEVQNIHHELWEPVRQAFKILGHHFNCYFIMMSATQPLIFDPETEITELVPDYRAYFRNDLFNRTKLINKTKTPVSFDDFCLEIKNYHEANPHKNLLVILNTKDFTRKCFERLTTDISQDSANLYFLSTFLTPFERKRIIERIKSKKAEGGVKPNIIISTQLIEAGVDLSVHTVFRVLAPLDSIIQAAGRANRYNELGKISEVFIYLIEGKMEQLSERIYGPALLEKTKQVLEKIETVEERNYLDLIEAYFKKIRQRADGMESQLYKDLCLLNFQKVGNFEFIEERRTESVFIQLNEEAKSVWEEYVAIEKNEQQLDAYDQKAAFAKIKGHFYDFVINVPISWGKDHIEFDSEPEYFFYVSKLEHPSVCYRYDYDTNGENFRLNLGYVPVKKQSLFDP